MIDSKENKDCTSEALLTFCKAGRARFLSILEVQTALHRALRRAHIPVRYTAGFSPQIRMIMPPPLPVGVAGLREKAIIFLEKPFETEMESRLAAAMPPLLPLIQLRAIGAAEKKAFGTAIFRAQKKLLSGNMEVLANCRSVGNGRAVEFELSPNNGNYPSLRKIFENSTRAQAQVPEADYNRSKASVPLSLSGVIRVEIFLQDERRRE